jgi:hypothetical protein
MKLRNLMMSAAVLAIFTASSAFSQSLSSGQTTDVALNATLGETLTVSLDQTAIDFTLASGSATNAGSTGVNAGVAWVLQSGRTAVKLYAYFTSATSALNNGTYLIPSSAVSATLGGTSAGAFTGATPFGGSTGITVSNTEITTNLVGSTSTLVALNIDLSSLTSLPAGSYTGTLHFQAQATT